MGVCEEYELHHAQIQKQLAEMDEEPTRPICKRCGWEQRGEELETWCRPDVYHEYPSADDCPNCDCGIGVHVVSHPISGPMLTCTKCRRTCA